jgi:hypothetical protein
MVMLRVGLKSIELIAPNMTPREGKDKKTNSDLQNTTQTVKIEQGEPRKKNRR